MSHSAGWSARGRRELLARARALWRGAALICVTHDVADTQAFGRVVVVEQGRIVEDGAPAGLGARPDSRYAELLRAEEEVAGMAGKRKAAGSIAALEGGAPATPAHDQSCAGRR